MKDTAGTLQSTKDEGHARKWETEKRSYRPQMRAPMRDKMALMHARRHVNGAPMTAMPPPLARHWKQLRHRHWHRKEF
eukprot:6214435-Pleurochrysis_carterae.AAC.1